MSVDKLSSQEYVEGIKTGDPMIIRGIYRKYHQAIVHMVETKDGTKEDANDVFQEGLVLLFQKVKQPDFQLTSTFLTYFYAVCRNIWYNKMKKKVNQEVTLDDGKLLMLKDDDIPLYENSEKYFLYRKMFLNLGADCQRVLDLFLQKINMEEIMKTMGYGSISYTKKRKFMCKEKLVKMIQNDPSFNELKSQKFSQNKSS
jgi:RNA polymerase sigma factor (sigma-70 family)